MWPTEMLSELKAERSRVREMIADASRLLGRSSASCDQLRDYVLALRRALLSYTDREDELLPRVLETLAGWGEVQAARVRHEHAERRAMLACALDRAQSLTERCSSENPAPFAEFLGQLLAEVLEVLEDEEPLLAEAAIRNEIISCDGIDG